MPIYEFYCPRCEKTFEAYASLRAAEEGWQPACPECGEENVARIFFSRFAVGASAGSGGGCSPSAGPGCCG